MTISDAELIKRATTVLNPRWVSPSVEVGSVASSLVTDRGTVFVGVCMDTACSLGFCAEHAAIAAMITAGQSRIATIVAVNQDRNILSPCGKCRELIYQVDPGNGETRVLLREGRQALLRELMPEWWCAD